MHVTAHLDVDLVAVETEDQVSVLVELTAPAAPEQAGTGPRPARTLQVVLDRSGSMGGDRLRGAITALCALIDRLDPKDNFGLVAFDDQVELTVPAGPLTDKATAKRAVEALTARGSTDLSAGYLRGVQEARRVAGPAGATLLLVSDGHANAGITDPARLAGVAAEHRRHGVITSTLGFGLGYDERIMAALARGGAGNELFAEESDTAVALIAGEVEGLLSQTAQAASVLIRLSGHVRDVQVVNDLSVSSTTGGILAELGTFYAEETRKLLLVFDVPAVAALGLTEIATLEFSYVELPALKSHTVTVPLHVNVVPGDEAAGRIPDPVVRTELLYQRVQQAKRRASGHLTAGDSGAALAEINSAQELVRQASSIDPSGPLSSDLAEEAQALAYLARQTQAGMLARAAKYSSMDAAAKSSKRGREYGYTQSSYDGEVDHGPAS
ncbi:MAG TPA: VWA domain-containing protein [Micromonosporaceae bacterium]